jgi:RimJ/RimL family protein N-acetyltransferase
LKLEEIIIGERRKGKMIKLRPISDEDIAEIKSWPSYTDEFEQMDYALRENGWFDEFRGRAKTWLYAVESNNRLTGFSLLSITADKEAEFRIAIHPDWTGKGLGREVTLATLQTGFRQLNLARICLIVRKNNPRAAMLYKNIGFVTTGESVHAIQGKDIEFIDMNMTREQFDKLKFEEGV